MIIKSQSSLHEHTIMTRLKLSGSLATQWLRHQTKCQTVSINEEDLRHVKVEEEFHLNKRTQMNFYFAVIIVAVLASVVFGPSFYTNRLYSKFDLTIQGKPSVQYVPLSQSTPQPLTPSSLDGQSALYDHLRSSPKRIFRQSWESTPTYKVDGTSGLWFKVIPEINGTMLIESAAEGTPLNAVGIEIHNQQGQQAVQNVVPGQWYKVKQYGKWYTLKLQWDK